MMWKQNQQDDIASAPYRMAQRRANKIQPRDPEQVEEPQTPLQNAVMGGAQGSYASPRMPRQAPDFSMEKRTQPYPPGNRGTGAPISQPYSTNPNISGNRTQVGDQTRTMEASQAPGGEYSRFAPRVGQVGGQNYLFEHGNRRLLSNEQELADATKYANDYREKYPTGFQPGVGPQTNAEYRAPRASMDMFGNFAGFDAENYQNFDRDKSAKYTFADAAASSGYVPRTKQEAEQWAKQYVVPELEARGYKVHWVQGDKMMVSTRENPQGEVVDFIQGADGDNPMFAWQSEGPGGGNAGGPLQNAITGVQNPMQAPSMVPDNAGNAFEALMQDPQWRQLLASLGVKI